MALRGQRRLVSTLVSLLAGLLLLAGLALALHATAQVTRANPGQLFVTPTGGGDCSQANPCTLAAALAQATDGDRLYLAAGVYTGQGPAVITLTQSITLYGGWDGSPTGTPVRDPQSHVTRLDGENRRRVIYITGTVYPVLDGLTVANGNATGLGGFNAYDAGGGIYVNQARVWIRDTTLVSNTAGSQGTGGALFFLKSDGLLESSRLVGNAAQWGGGMRVVSGAATIRNSQFLSNTALFGGGLYLMWSRSTVVGNAFVANTATNGGGLYLSGDASTLLANRIQGNRATFGAGIEIASGAPALTVASNRILSNTALSTGGGIQITFNAGELHNNVIAHNSAAKGAGVYIQSAAPRLRHNTLAQNRGGNGEGLFLAGGAQATLTNTVLVSHTVGIRVTGDSTATLEATLWGAGDWGNQVDWQVDSGSLVTGTVNLWGDPAFLDPARGDYHIGPASAARDAGVESGITVDMDGQIRPVGPAPDLGADEWGHFLFLPQTTKP